VLVINPAIAAETQKHMCIFYGLLFTNQILFPDPGLNMAILVLIVILEFKFCFSCEWIFFYAFYP
jgi:hypothetical protein